MKIHVFPVSLDACGYYRLIWPAEQLAAEGHDITIIEPKHRGAQLKARMHGDIVLGVNVYDNPDIVVMQRVTHKYLSQAVKVMRNQGITVIVDMDDDLSRVHPMNPAYKWLLPGNGGKHSWEYSEQACRNASWVTTSTPALQDIYASHGRGSVLENCIPQRMLDLPRGDRGTFGWPGYLLSHYNDPPMLGGSVKKLVTEGFKFSMVGNPTGMAKVLKITEQQLNCTGITDMMGWPNALTTLHVGLAPLADTMFNDAKSWLKPLELSAVGVPTVMSPRREYKRIHSLGVGVLAEAPNQWYQQVKRLMTDDAWYAEVANRSKLAVTGMTIEQNAHRWADVWLQARENDQKHRQLISRA